MKVSTVELWYTDNVHEGI